MDQCDLCTVDRYAQASADYTPVRPYRPCCIFKLSFNAFGSEFSQLENDAAMIQAGMDELHRMQEDVRCWLVF